MRIRTAAAAHAELLQQDPATSISERQIRALMKSGKIPVIHKGENILLVDMDIIEDYFKNPCKYANDTEVSTNKKQLR